MAQIDCSRLYWGKKFGCIALGFALVSTHATGGPGDHTAPDGWRLFRSEDPNALTMSVSRTADVTRSDLELAGLIFRCGEGGIETLIVVVTPFPPRTHPNVTLTANNQEWSFDTEVITPGTKLLLPIDASSLARGQWRLARELGVKISLQERQVSGVIPIQGISQALFPLTAACSR
jgi:hypothetical protein